MKDDKIGLVVGRFQPFHKGHAYLLKKAVTIAEKIVIGIGSSNITNTDNPIDYQKRKKIVEMFVREEKLQKNIINIVAIPDIGNDDAWREETLKKVGKIDVVIGNNDWVNGIFRNAGFSIVKVPHYKRFLLEGYKIRKLAKEGKNWEERVPEYIVDIIGDSLIKHN